MAELLDPNPRKNKQIKGRLGTTAGLRAAIRVSENDLEVVELERDVFLAYDRNGFGKKRLNEKATALLRSAHPGPLKVYGAAVRYTIQDVI